VLAQQIQLVVLVAVVRQTALQQVLLERLTKDMPGEAVADLLLDILVAEVVLVLLVLTEVQEMVAMVVLE
jgi:hypothetical protein